MTAQELISYLEDNGFVLWAEDGALRFHGPKNILTSSLREKLAEAKPEILELLRQQEHSLPPLCHLSEDEGKPFPLTDLQGAYFVGRSDIYAHGGMSCHGYFELELPQLDTHCLTLCWRKIVERHPMLRTVFLPDATQRVLNDVPHFEIGETDLRDTDENDYQIQLDSIREKMSHQRFDATQWPLFDLHVSHAPEKSRLHVSIDLLIADYLSISIIMEELGILYHDPERTLPPLEVTFRDIVLAEKQLVNQKDFERDRAYWKKRLSAFPDAPALPVVDRDVSHPWFMRRHMTLDPKEQEILAQQAAKRNMTLGGVLLAVFAKVIGRWSATDHFALNLTVLNRLPWHEDTMRLVGDFTSVNLLEVQSNVDESFAAFARNLQAQLWDDLEHRLFGGVRVLRELSRERGTTVLMPVVFTNTVGVRDQQDQHSFFRQGNMVHGISQTPQVWLDCQVMEAGGKLHIQWDCLEDVFPAGMLDSMFSAFCEQVHRLTEDDSAWDTPLRIALPQEQVCIRDAANATAEPYEPLNLYTFFARQSELTPQAEAVLTPERTLTYKDLELLSGGVSLQLAKHGVSPGENVAIFLEKGWMQPVAVLGVLAAGGTYIPIDPAWPEMRIQYILKKAGVRVVLAASHQAEQYASWEGIIPISVDAVKASPGPVDLRPVNTTAYIIYTSGTTGEPKGVIISHAAVANTIGDVNRRFGITAADRILGVSRLSFDLSVYDIFGPLAVGGAIVIPSQHSAADPASWVEAARRFNVTIWNSVPTFFEMMLEYGENTGIIPESLRLAMLSGDRIPLSLPDRAWRLLPHIVLHSLGGATEVSIWSIHFPITEVSPHWPSIPYGKALANQSFHVLNSALEQCPDFVPGDLYIGGIGLADGYFNDPARTQESFIFHTVTGERLYKTGDIGCMLPDGNIRFMGRRDSQVKIRGHRIELGEIESCIRMCPGVDEAIALINRKKTGNPRLTAFIVPERSETDADAKVWDNVKGAVSAATERILAGTEVPRMHAFFEQMDTGALVAMREFFCRRNAFPEGEWRSPEELMHSLAIPPRHCRLFRRILSTLHRHDFLEKRNDEYGNVLFADRDMVLAAWDTLAAMHEHFPYGQELMDLLRKGALNFEALLLDQADPLQLLYPEGCTDVAVAVQVNYTSNFMNSLVIATVLTISDSFSSSLPMRIFEVGAGVGGTSNSLIPALPGEKCRYTCSDLSNFFISAARERYKAYPFMDYAIFDINERLETQGVARGNADVVIASNVLHNAVVAKDVLRNLRGLLAPGGWLVFIESTRDNLSVMTSMEFLSELYHFEDERKESNSPFLPTHRWASLLAETGADRVACFPGEGHPLSRVGQTVFIARFGGRGAVPDEETILRHVRERLPEYMIPSQLDMVSVLPVTSNGKIDRKALTALISPAPAATTSVVAPQDEVEQQLAAMIKKLLVVDVIGVEEDFYAAGGDSLLLTQLVARIRDAFGRELLEWDETLRFAVQNPTIRALAELVHAKRQEAETGESESGPTPQGSGREKTVTLLSLRAGSEGWSRLFLIPDGTATIAGFNPLLSRLDQRLHVSALTPASVDAYLSIPPAELIPTLARWYVHALETDGSEFPFICGSCMGGLVALEVARLLERNNKHLGAVAVINSVKPPYTINDSLLSYLTFIQEIRIAPLTLGIDVHAIGRAVAAVIGQGEDIPERAVLTHLPPESPTHAACQSIATMSREERLTKAFELYSQSPGFSGTMPRSRLDGIFRVVEHSIQGVNAYVPRAVESAVTLFRREEEDAFLIPLGRLMREFWEQYAGGGLHVVNLPGNHWTSMQASGATIIADGLFALAKGGSS